MKSNMAAHSMAILYFPKLSKYPDIFLIFLSLLFLISWLLFIHWATIPKKLSLHLHFTLSNLTNFNSAAV